MTFALPRQPAAHVFNYNTKFNKAMVRRTPSGEYNILCNHLRLDADEVRRTMPPNTKMITVVRNPGIIHHLNKNHVQLQNHIAKRKANA